MKSKYLPMLVYESYRYDSGYTENFIRIWFKVKRRRGIFANHIYDKEYGFVSYGLVFNMKN